MHRDPGKGQHRNPRRPGLTHYGGIQSDRGRNSQDSTVSIWINLCTEIVFIKMVILNHRVGVPAFPSQPLPKRSLVKGEKENDTKVQGRVFCPRDDVVPEASTGSAGTSHRPSAHTLGHMLATFLAFEGYKSPNAIT